MTVERKTEGTTLTLAPDGRIDTLTAPDLEKAIALDGITDAIFEFAKVDYISSAGLRVLVRTQKRLGAGHVVIAHASAVVREVFDVVGFDDAFSFR